MLKHISIAGLILLIILAWFGPLQPINPPLRFEMDSIHKLAASSEFVFHFDGKDTTTKHDMYMLYDSAQHPLLYYANINTPVCIDNICKPVAIEIYWNLLGHYVGFGIYPDRPLTKYDHDLFVNEDYDLLHALLLDKHSILERRELSDLFDPNAEPERQIEYKGQKVDAVSGATVREIKESVVEGALFSCYTLWHLINGSVVPQMRDAMHKRQDSLLLEEFLHSDYADYQYYSVKNLSPEDLHASFLTVFSIFQKSSPLVRTYILKKLPDATWQDERYAAVMYSNFSRSDISTRTLLLNHLSLAHVGAIPIVLGQIGSMTKNHLQIFLAHLVDDPAKCSDAVLDQLQNVVKTEGSPYSYLIEEFLSELAHK